MNYEKYLNKREMQQSYEDASRQILKYRYLQLIVKTRQLFNKVSYKKDVLKNISHNKSSKFSKQIHDSSEYLDFLLKMYIPDVWYKSCDLEAFVNNDTPKIKKYMHNLTSLINDVRVDVRKITITLIKPNYKNIKKIR